MACPFCGKVDGMYDYQNHMEKHKIEFLQRIAKALERIAGEIERDNSVTEPVKPE